jgi:hypothetical protein
MQRSTLAGLGLALLLTAAVVRADETLAPQAPDQPPMGAPAQGPGGPPQGGPGAVPQDAAMGGQDTGNGMAAPEGQGPPAGMAAGDPGQAFEELQSQLDLSSDQQNKLKVISEDAQARNREHMKAMMALIKTLDAQVQAKAPDGDLQATLDKIKAEHKAMQADKDAVMDQRENVLNVHQSAKFVLALRDKMRQGMLRRMRKQGGGPGAGGQEPEQP